MVADEGGGGSGSTEPEKAIVYAKGSGLVCGRLVVERLLSNHYPTCSIEWNVEEGMVNIVLINYSSVF